MDETNGTARVLEHGATILASINGYLAGVGAAIVLGKSIAALFKTAGGQQYLTPEAQAEIDKLESHLEAASAFNSGWQAAHPPQG